MLKTLMTTTALVGLLAVGAAVAQDAAPAAPATESPAVSDPATPTDGTTSTDGTTAAPATDASKTMSNDASVTGAAGSSILASGYTVTDKDNLATEIIGKQVYSSAAADAEHIGDVNNLVVGDHGEIAAVIIGVGGFLGMGEKNVAVNYAELEWVTAEDNTERFVLPTTKEALEAAPDFQTTDAQAPVDATNPPPADNAMAPADNTMAPADNAMAPADNTMAPAADAATSTDTKAAATPIDRTTLKDATITAKDVIGTDAYGPNDEHLGKVGDVVLGQDGSTVDALVIDFGGFLGLGTKPVAVGVENLRYSLDANGNKYLFMNVTRDQLDAAIAFDANAYKADPTTQRLTTNAM